MFNVKSENGIYVITRVAPKRYRLDFVALSGDAKTAKFFGVGWKSYFQARKAAKGYASNEGIRAAVGAHHDAIKAAK